MDESEVYKGNVNRQDELLVRNMDAAARMKKPEDQLNTRSSQTSCKVHWGWRWDFRTFIVHCNIFFSFLWYKFVIRLLGHELFYYYSESFCVGRFKHLYLGNHSELETYSYAHFITNTDTFSSQTLTFPSKSLCVDIQADSWGKVSVCMYVCMYVLSCE